MLVPILHVAYGTFAARLLAIIEAGGDLEKAATMRLYGAVFAYPLLYGTWARIKNRKYAAMMDVATICIVVGLIPGRMNCIMSGCCDGILIISGGAARWPLREIEIVFYFIFMAVYCKRILKGKTCGQVYPALLMSYGVLRFLLEFLREEFTAQIGIFHLAHIWSLISIVVGAGVYYKVMQSQKNNLKGRKGHVARADHRATKKGGNS